MGISAMPQHFDNSKNSEEYSENYQMDMGNLFCSLKEGDHWQLQVCRSQYSLMILYFRGREISKSIVCLFHNKKPLKIKSILHLYMIYRCIMWHEIGSLVQKDRHSKSNMKIGESFVEEQQLVGLWLSVRKVQKVFGFYAHWHFSEPSR